MPNVSQLKNQIDDNLAKVSSMADIASLAFSYENEQFHGTMSAISCMIHDIKSAVEEIHEIEVRQNQEASKAKSESQQEYLDTALKMIAKGTKLEKRIAELETNAQALDSQIRATFDKKGKLTLGGYKKAVKIAYGEDLKEAAI